MTPTELISEIDHMEIETYRYRAPAVVPLSDGRLAVLTPGMEHPYRIYNNFSDLWIAVELYTNWNAAKPRKTAPASTALLEELGLK